MKEGQEEARELSAKNYGRDEWWVMLNPIEDRVRERLVWGGTFWAAALSVCVRA